MRLELKNSDDIRLRIALNGDSIRSFSENIGVSHSYLSQIINNKKNPSAPTAKKICSGLGANIEDFFLITMVDEQPKGGVNL